MFDLAGGSAGHPLRSYQPHPLIVNPPTRPPRSHSVAIPDLANGRLLVVDGYGYTEFLNPSTCAAN